MTSGVQTVIYPAKDVAATKALLTALLGDPIMDEPYYIGYRAHGQDIGIDPNLHAKGVTGPVCYWNVADIEATLATLVAAGGEIIEGTHDVGGGKLVATVRDADGKAVGLMQAP